MGFRAKSAAPRDFASLLAQEAMSLRETIRARAQELYEKRGREEGHDLEDWLAAETEVLGTRHRVHRERVAKVSSHTSDAASSASAPRQPASNSPPPPDEGEDAIRDFLHVSGRSTSVIQSICLLCQRRIAHSPREDALRAAEKAHRFACSSSPRRRELQQAN